MNWMCQFEALEWIWLSEKIRFDYNKGEFHVQTGFSQPASQDKVEAKRVRQCHHISHKHKHTHTHFIEVKQFKTIGQ